MPVGDSWRPAGGSEKKKTAPKPSYYNVTAYLSPSDEVALYNTASGALAVLSAEEYEVYCAFDRADSAQSGLRELRPTCEESVAGRNGEAVRVERCGGGAGASCPDLVPGLIEAGFLLYDPEEERSYLRFRYTSCQFDDNALWIGCSFGPDESRMSDIAGAIVSFVAEQYDHQPVKRLFVTWAVHDERMWTPVIDSLDASLRSWCEARTVAYELVKKGQRFCALTEGSPRDRKHDTDSNGKAPNARETSRRGSDAVRECERLLEPIGFFCSATINRAYVIDETGDAYKCGNEVGVSGKAAFNIFEPAAKRRTNWTLLAKAMNDNPADDEVCGTCRVLPLCQGGCHRLRTAGTRRCAEVKSGIDDIVRRYCSAIGEAESDGAR